MKDQAWSMTYGAGCSSEQLLIKYSIGPRYPEKRKTKNCLEPKEYVRNGGFLHSKLLLKLIELQLASRHVPKDESGHGQSLVIARNALFMPYKSLLQA